MSKNELKLNHRILKVQEETCILTLPSLHKWGSQDSLGLSVLPKIIQLGSELELESRPSGSYSTRIYGK